MTRICDECKDPEKEYYARGYCKSCYRRLMAGGKLNKICNTRPVGDYSKNICITCKIEGIQLTKNQCRTCYLKVISAKRYYSDPEAAKERVKEWQIANPERVKEVKRQSYQRHQPEIRERVRKYAAENKDKISARVKSKYHANKEHFKFQRIKQIYGLSKEDYLKMLADQNNTCAICKIETALVIDHDHKTNKVRQLLCGDCNTTLGFLERRGSHVFENAQKYLETHQQDVLSLNEV